MDTHGLVECARRGIGVAVQHEVVLDAVEGVDDQSRRGLRRGRFHAERDERLPSDAKPSVEQRSAEGMRPRFDRLDQRRLELETL